jgi:hypothetical protein
MFLVVRESSLSKGARRGVRVVGVIGVGVLFDARARNVSIAVLADPGLPNGAQLFPREVHAPFSVSSLLHSRSSFPATTPDWWRS